MEVHKYILNNVNIIQFVDMFRTSSFKYENNDYINKGLSVLFKGEET